MTPYNSVNVKLSNSQLHKLKSTTKNETAVTQRLSSGMIDNSNVQANFPHKLFLADRLVSNLHKVFANNLSANIKLTKIQKLSYLNQCNQVDFLVDFLNH